MEVKNLKKKRLLKILLLGEGGVGKTTFVQCLNNKSFNENQPITPGIDVGVYKYKQNNIEYYMQLWDFGGQDRFKFLHDSFIDGAHAVLIFFDLTRPKTLQNIDFWINMCVKNNLHVPLLLVGTKLDRYRTEEKWLEKLDMSLILENLNIEKYDLISSKEKIGLNELIADVVQVINEKEKAKESEKDEKKENEEENGAKTPLLYSS